MTASSNPILDTVLFSTLGRSDPMASAVDVMDGKFAAICTPADLIRLAGPPIPVIDSKGARVAPRRIDNYIAGSFGPLDAAPPSPATPDRTRVGHDRSYGPRRQTPRAVQPSAAQHTFAPNVARSRAGVPYGLDHATVWSAPLPMADLKSSSGCMNCSCRAI